MYFRVSAADDIYIRCDYNDERSKNWKIIMQTCGPVDDQTEASLLNKNEREESR